MSELTLNPSKMADFLSTVPKTKTKLVTEAILSRMSPTMRENFINAYSVSSKLSPNTQQAVRGLTTSASSEATK